MYCIYNNLQDLLARHENSCLVEPYGLFSVDHANSFAYENCLALCFTFCECGEHF
jgi:hypothetical protein